MVILRTPAELVTEYQLSSVDDRASDDEILAAARSAQPSRHGDTEIVGAPYVYARGLDALAQQGQRLQQAEERLEAERAASRALAQAYFDNGKGMSKRDIVTALRIARTTLDAWLTQDPPVRRTGHP